MSDYSDTAKIQKRLADREYFRQWRIKNAERKRTQDKAWRVANKERKSESDKAWRKKNPEKVHGYQRKYYRLHTEKILEQQRQSDRSSKDVRYNNRHREAVRARNRAWAKKNVVRKRMLDAKRRALQRDATVEDVTKWAEFIRSRKSIPCFHCGKRISGRRAHLDHLVPISKGGAHAVYNLVASCPNCNQRKCDKHPNNFIEVGQLLLV